MRRFVNLVLLVGVVFFFGSAREALAQYATGPDGQYAGGVKAATLPKKADESETFFAIEPYLGSLSGHTTYQVYIGNAQAHSELEFPMDSWIAGIGVSTGRKDAWDIALAVATNVARDTGKMKDSDWG